ncbi:MAG TPA: glycoside hydrolase N-terminal domain-containing protein [Chthoniobacteraceae bacterium]
MKLPALLFCLLALSAQAQNLTPVTDTGRLMPRHGTVSTVPARNWEDGLAAGNGNMGAMLFGHPAKDTILVNHCKLWLPAGSREVLPKAGESLAEMRRIIAEKGYGEGQKFFLQKARDSGWSGKLVWTDVFHPGFLVNLEQPESGPVTDYARVEDFSRGEVWAQWQTPAGSFARRMFVSKADNTIVNTTTGPAGKVSLKLTMQKVDNKLIDSTVTHAEGWITCHNVYNQGKGGYDGVVRVIAQGGTQTSDGSSISISGADSVTVLMRVLPYRTPLPSSQAWTTDPKNPDFAGPRRAAERQTVQIAGPQYDARWMDEVKADLQSLSPDYAALIKPHSVIWSQLFDRVTIDLNGSPEERAMSSEAILDKAKREQKLTPALLERMYDAGRYVFMCSAGPETPPNLFGIWSGTWSPRWSGDYTTDTNLQLDTALAYSGNLAELMRGYFHLWNSFIPDFRANAQALYGARGILIGTRHSNNGLHLHWDGGWPGNQWTPGAAWLAHWYYDYYQYTGDREFLRKVALPWMTETALFWEDFLKGTEDANGRYTFRPSFSAENGSGDNTSQDIQITHELFTNLIAGCETLGIEQEGVARWKAMLAKLPPLLINDRGQLKEWSNPKQGENNNHRHLMHLYGAFQSEQFTEEADPRIFAAARVALENRVRETSEGAIHGYMHTGLAAVGLGMGDLAYQRVEMLAKKRAIFPNMVDGHFGGPDLLCDDGNGATPEIVNRMLVASKIGRLTLLPAVPNALPKGAITGIRARGAIAINKLAWDVPGGTCEASLTSANDQQLALVMGRDLPVTSITVDGKAMPVSEQGVKKLGIALTLPKGKAVTVAVKFGAPAAATP